MPVCPECHAEISQDEIDATGRCGVCGHEFARTQEVIQQSGGPAKEARTIKGMNEAEYLNCISNLGLLEGEKVRLEYVCFRHVMSPPSSWRKEPRVESKKGLLVFTNDNMIFMQQEGAWSSNYAQAIRIPLEQIVGVVSGGTLTDHLRITIGSEQHEFVDFRSVYRVKSIHEVRNDIEKLLKDVREERKRMAQQAARGNVTPRVIFCKYCGARNKADQSRCVNCSAVLT